MGNRQDFKSIFFFIFIREVSFVKVVEVFIGVLQVVSGVCSMVGVQAIFINVRFVAQVRIIRGVGVAEVIYQVYVGIVVQVLGVQGQGWVRVIVVFIDFIEYVLGKRGGGSSQEVTQIQFFILFFNFGFGIFSVLGGQEQRQRVIRLMQKFSCWQGWEVQLFILFLQLLLVQLVGYCGGGEIGFFLVRIWIFFMKIQRILV